MTKDTLRRSPVAGRQSPVASRLQWRKGRHDATCSGEVPCRARSHVWRLGAALYNRAVTPAELAQPQSDAAPEPFFADRVALKRNFGRAAASFAQGDALHREIGARMLERLGYIKLTPARALDLGCATGGALPGLQERYPQAQLLALDLAHPMLRAAVPAAAPWHARLAATLLKKHGPPLGVQADMARLPFKSGAFDLAWSNLALHWQDDPAPAIREAQRVLAVNGLFMFSTLGPDTLVELRDAFARAEAARPVGEAMSVGAAARTDAATAGSMRAAMPGQTAAADGRGSPWHVKRFIDLHDIGDVLVGAGFTTPVMDMEKITLTYASLDGLFADLRASGSGNAMLGRARGLMGRGLLQGVRQAYEVLRAGRADGRLPATFEVIYGHAWKGQPRRTAAGEAIVSFVPGGEYRSKR